MHLNIPICEACEEKLKQVHADLSRFVRILRVSHPDAHISCGYRGQQDQEADFKKGVSRAHYGQSAHNTLPAMAVDFFRITLSGGAAFERPWYESTIATIARAAGLVVGGDWKSIKDWPHVELPGFIPFKQ